LLNYLTLFVGVMEYGKQLKISFPSNFWYPSDIKVLKQEQNAKVPYLCYSLLGILKTTCFVLERTGFVLIFGWWEFLCSVGINGSINQQTSIWIVRQHGSFSVMSKTYFKAVRNVRWIFVKFSSKQLYDVPYMHQTT
jgi:hypothetical protein